jgi:hypothetical protein
MTSNWTEEAQGVGAILGVIITIIGFIFIYRQIKQTQKTIEQSNHTSIYAISAEFNKYLADNSELRPFLYEGKEFDKNHMLSNKILIVCEMLTDMFEFIIIEHKSINSSIYGTWRSYIELIYSNSPAFRYYTELYRSTYSKELLMVFHEISINLPVEAD